jgi:hypothetical protein
MSDLLSNPNEKSLELYSKTLDNLHKLQKLSISESGTIDKSVSNQYIMMLIKIDFLSGERVLSDLYPYFNL